MDDPKERTLWGDGAGAFKDALVPALAQRELFLVYQARFSLASGRLCGAEALARWDHPEQGLLMPADFVGVAERVGAVSDLDAFVIKEACRQMKTWEADGALPLEFYMAVNVSALDFNDPGFPGRARSAIERFGANPAQLRFEMTCTSLPKSTALEVESELRALGVGLDLDHFGAGFTSLSEARRLRPGRVGIHPSFLNLPRPEGQAVVEATVQLFHTLGALAVAKGIESEEVLSWLRGLGCDEGQGFYLGRPVPPADLEPLLREACREQCKTRPTSSVPRNDAAEAPPAIPVPIEARPPQSVATAKVVPRRRFLPRWPRGRS